MQRNRYTIQYNMNTKDNYNYYGVFLLDSEKKRLKEMFWDIGKYEVNMDVEYGKTNKVFRLGFEVSNEKYKDLCFNIDEVLISILKNQYNQQIALKTVQVEIKEV